MHCHFLLQIMQANRSILPYGLCTHSHIPTLHRVYSHGHPELPKRVSAQIVGLWKVTGRKLETESQAFPTPHSPAQLMSPSRFHQHHSRISGLPPRPLPTSHDSSDIWVPGDPGGPTCKVRGLSPRLSPASERFATESLG